MYGGLNTKCCLMLWNVWPQRSSPTLNTAVIKINGVAGFSGPVVLDGHPFFSFRRFAFSCLLAALSEGVGLGTDEESVSGSLYLLRPSSPRLQACVLQSSGVGGDMPWVGALVHVHSSSRLPPLPTAHRRGTVQECMQEHRSSSPVLGNLMQRSWWWFSAVAWCQEQQVGFFCAGVSRCTRQPVPVWLSLCIQRQGWEEDTLEHDIVLSQVRRRPQPTLSVPPRRSFGFHGFHQATS